MWKLDGEMGSILMTHGTRNCSAMSLTHPAAVLDVHMSYVLAGSSLLFTNTFQANSLSQRKIGMDEADTVRRMNMESVNIARMAGVMVAVSVGPIIDPPCEEHAAAYA